MTIVQGVALFVAAMLGGALNSVAGGGSFLTFPMLIFSGVPSINANATSTVALWPGSVASVGAYRAELAHVRHRVLLSAVSVVGGGLGAILLLKTPTATFTAAIPYLLLLATLLFAFNGPITDIVRRSRRAASGSPTVDGATPGGRTAEGVTSPRAVAAVAAAQLVIATYGGYFGGGIGILMLATLGLMGMERLHTMNALKTLLATCINGVAVVLFVLAHAVEWPQATVMLVAAILGSYGSARYALRIDQRLLRRIVVAVGLIRTVYFFVTTHR